MKYRNQVIVGSDERTGDETVLLKIIARIPDAQSNENASFHVSIASQKLNRQLLLVKPDHIYVTETLENGAQNYVALDRSSSGTWSFRYGLVVAEDEQGWLIQGSLGTYGNVVFDSQKTLDKILEVSLQAKSFN